MLRHFAGRFFGRMGRSNTAKNKSIITLEDRLAKIKPQDHSIDVAQAAMESVKVEGELGDIAFETEVVDIHEDFIEQSNTPIKGKQMLNSSQYNNNNNNNPIEYKNVKKGNEQQPIMRHTRTVVSDIDFLNKSNSKNLTTTKFSSNIEQNEAKEPLKNLKNSDSLLKPVNNSLPSIVLSREALSQIEIDVGVEKEKLTKYLARSSICSRRQADKLIQEGLVRVNGKKVLSNIDIDPLRDEVTLFTKKGEYFPMKETTKVWTFYKPMGLICTHKDPNNRPTIFEYIKKSKKIAEDFIISVGRLDFNSEGLMILTNDGELARAMELPSSKLERTYRVRVYGRFTDEKLAKIREGCVINGVKYGPFYCNVDSYQTSNTWLMIKMSQGKNREIRRVMQKNDLRVNRLKRLTYGPYSLANMESGEIREDMIRPEIKRLMYLYNRAKLKDQTEKKKTVEEIKDSVEKKLEGRLLDPLPLIRRSKELPSYNSEEEDEIQYQEPNQESDEQPSHKLPDSRQEAKNLKSDNASKNNSRRAAKNKK